MTLTTFFVAVALVGSFFNATLRMKLSYVLWLISNTYLCVHNFAIGEHAQSFLFGAYLITTFIGLRNTYKDPHWFRRRT
jgi:hypothetical protein